MDGHAATLLLVAGPPGVGKTTLAFAVGKRLGWTVLDKDTLKSCLLDLGAPEAIAGPASYELLLEIARDALSIILDCPAHHRSFLERCATLASEYGGDFRILLCLLDREARVRRMANRSVRSSQWVTLDHNRETDPEEWVEFFPDHSLVLWLDNPVEIVTGRAIDALRTCFEREGRDG